MDNTDQYRFSVLLLNGGIRFTIWEHVVIDNLVNNDAELVSGSLCFF